MKKILLGVFGGVAILFVFIVVSCATRNELLNSTDELVAAGKYQEAYEELKKEKKNVYNGKKDEILYLLDSGAIALHAKENDVSIKELTDADNRMDELRDKKFIEQAGANFINDTVITYNGYDYEYVFTSLLLSLNYLEKQSFDGGFVEIRRTQNKLEKIQVDANLYLSEYNKNKDSKYVAVDEIKIPFVDSAFARLLSFWLYRADYDFTNMEVAARKYKDAIEAQPTLYDFDAPRIEDEQLSTQGNRIQVVSLTDRAPILISKQFSLNAVPGGVIVTQISEASSLPSNITPINSSSGFFDGIGAIAVPGLGSTGLSVVFAVPEMAVYDQKVYKVEVWANEAHLGDLTLTEDIEQIATETFAEASKLIYARQVARVITKTVTGVMASEVGNEVDPALGLVMGLSSQIVNNVSEKADLRMTRYFPAKIWTGDFLMPAEGTYKVMLKYMNNSGNIIKEREYEERIAGSNATLNLIVDSYL